MDASMASPVRSSGWKPTTLTVIPELLLDTSLALSSMNVDVREEFEQTEELKIVRCAMCKGSSEEITKTVWQEKRALSMVRA